MNSQLTIYTDGACKGNPGPGGWGFMIDCQPTFEAFGGESQTTNNRMELTAAIKALQHLHEASAVRIHTDSQYVLKGATEWLPGWKARGWRTATGSAVKNVDLWTELDRLTNHSGHDVAWQWVRGHNGNPGNERADALANQGVSAALRR